MIAPLQAQTKAVLPPSYTPVQTGLLQRQCTCGQHTIAGEECEECRKKREGTIQRAAVSAAPVNAVPPSVHEVLSSSGQPLDAETRSFMEPRFGHDFSQVRVHTGAKAAESAKSVNALAYTVGRDIVFGVGQYAPGTNEGKQLLAHELTHIIQQQGTARIQYVKAEDNRNEKLDEAIALVQHALDSADFLTKASKGEEGNLTTPVVNEDQIQILQNALSNLLAKGSGKVDEDQIQILQNALSNLLALKGSGKVDEIWDIVKPILAVTERGGDIEKMMEMQRKGTEGEEGDVFESEAELVAHRVMKGEIVGEPTYQVSNRYSGPILQRQQPEAARQVVEAARGMPHPAGKLVLLVVAGLVLLAYEIYELSRSRPTPQPQPQPQPQPEKPRRRERCRNEPTDDPLPIKWPRELPDHIGIGEPGLERKYHDSDAEEVEGAEQRGRPQSELAKKIKEARELTRDQKRPTLPEPLCFDDLEHKDPNAIYDAHHIQPLYLGGKEQEYNLCALRQEYHGPGHPKLNDQKEFLDMYLLSGICSSFLYDHPEGQKYTIVDYK